MSATMSRYTLPVLCVIIALYMQHLADAGHHHHFKSKFNKLRHITLKDDAFCEAYQEYRDGQCVAKLTLCSPLNDQQLERFRQIVCGLRFNAQLQPPPHIQEPPPPEDENRTFPFNIAHDYPPPYFLDIHPAQPHSFPWLAAIYSPQRQFLCTGALVGPKTIITSAQCVAGAAGGGGDGGGGGASEAAPAAQQNVGGNYFVRFGRHHLNISSPYDKAYEYDVESIEVSQQFDRTTLDNDFAILRLVSPACKFAPIALPKKDDWENGHFFGTKTPVVYAGWGLGHYQAPYLRSLTSHLIPKDECLHKFNWHPEQLSSNHLCVLPPINVCVGGAGTPLVAYAGHSHCILLGLMSFGEHCNSAKLPLVFTKVSTYIDEIHRYIDEDFRAMNETLPEFEECFHSKDKYFKKDDYHHHEDNHHGGGGGGGHYHHKPEHYYKS